MRCLIPCNENLAELVHHYGAVLFKRVRVPFERDGGVFVTHYCRKRFDVHTALQSARRKGMAEGVEAPVRQTEFLQNVFKRALIGTYGQFGVRA